MSKYSSEDEFIIQYKTVIVYLFLIVGFIISLLFFDYFVLPTSKTKDVITYASVRTSSGKNGSKRQTISYQYYTKKGFSFSTIKDDVEENDIEIEYSLVFKSVTTVRSKKNDYTKLLSNDLTANGLQFYLCIVLLFSIAISIKILLSKKGFSENMFFNIICFNSFMIFVCLYMTYLF